MYRIKYPKLFSASSVYKLSHKNVFSCVYFSKCSVIIPYYLSCTFFLEIKWEAMTKKKKLQQYFPCLSISPPLYFVAITLSFYRMKGRQLRTTILRWHGSWGKSCSSVFPFLLSHSLTHCLYMVLVKNSQRGGTNFKYL